MAPPVGSFQPQQLPEQIQYKTNGHKIKPPIDMKECQLKEMIQFDCDLTGPRESRHTGVVCKPVLRLFRQCANGVSIEVTSYEGIHDD